jgi:hypothetical protein
MKTTSARGRGVRLAAVAAGFATFTTAALLHTGVHAQRPTTGPVERSAAVRAQDASDAARHAQALQTLRTVTRTPITNKADAAAIEASLENAISMAARLLKSDVNHSVVNDLAAKLAAYRTQAAQETLRAQQRLNRNMTSREREQWLTNIGAAPAITAARQVINTTARALRDAAAAVQGALVRAGYKPPPPPRSYPSGVAAAELALEFIIGLAGRLVEGDVEKDMQTLAEAQQAAGAAVSKFEQCSATAASQFKTCVASKANDPFGRAWCATEYALKQATCMAGQ